MRPVCNPSLTAWVAKLIPGRNLRSFVYSISIVKVHISKSPSTPGITVAIEV